MKDGFQWRNCLNILTKINMLDQYLMGFLFAKSKFRTQLCFRVILMSLVLCFMVEFCWSSCSVDDCYRGVCSVDSHDGVCECDDGWTGDRCDHCGGRTRLDSESGIIHDSKEQYDTDRTCVWVVDSGRPDTRISLYLETFATECSWDYLYIFDGDSIYSPLVAAFSGPLRYNDVSMVHEVTTTSGYAFLYFYSDAAFKLEGFNITYRVDGCPFGCSKHGECDPVYKNCSCDPLWTGDACDIPACPANCSGNGQCSISQKMCLCEPGFKGSDCSVLSDEGYWQFEDNKAYGRASPAVVQQDNLVWIVGGYEFDKKNISIVSLNLDDRSSQEITQQGNIPETRYGHTAVLYEDAIYMYGGSLHGRKVVDEFHIFDVTTSTWMPNVTYDGEPLAVEGHTAVLYEDTMVVMFGYSPKYGYISAVQEYNFINKTWTIAKTTGARVLGTYGHSSAVDPIRNIVYVHAGFVPTSAPSDLTDDLYQYDLSKKEWRVLPSSSQPRFLHSAVILSDIMFVYGGNTHTDSVQFTGAKCLSSDFLAYHISCQTWSRLPSDVSYSPDIARYGHASFVYDEKIFIYSGFTGVMKDDILVYNPGNCSARTNVSLCLEITPGLSCQWDAAEEQCMLSDQMMESALLLGNSSMQQCPTTSPAVECTEIDNCSNCLQTPRCNWCNSKCQHLSECDNEVHDDVFCPDTVCEVVQNCRMCNEQEGCRWRNNKCDRNPEGDSSAGVCGFSCDDLHTCQSCLSMNSCMWCSNQQRCIDSNSYITSFPYGLCWEWHTGIQNCPVTNCSLYLTCELCHEDLHCGWCDSGDMTGIGTCKEGSATGPIKLDDAGNAVVDMGLCPAESWFFFDCPSCQCNGHSRCVNDTSVCENCQNNTTGPQCETCAEGYYGNALNGGSCTPCQCNNHGTRCDSSSGRCQCNTKGVIGPTCDSCDIQQNYFGNPLRGTCFYNLTVNYQYTFNLSSNDDLYLTMINLMTSPGVSNRDMEFELRVSKAINMNITFRSNSIPGIEHEIVYKADISYYSATFSSSDFNFEENANTTFFVYISNFTTPLSFKVSVQQRLFLLNLLEFLVVFFSCFLSFLLFFVVGWKVKQRWDSFRRQQNRAVELAVMARRPFATVNLVIENTVPPDIVVGTKKKHPLAISTANCSDNKAQVATIFMQMPMPDDGKVPFGQSRFCLASALVQIKAKKGERRNSHQKAEIPEPRSEGNLNNACSTLNPLHDNHDSTETAQRELVDCPTRPALHVIQNHFPASYDNAAMV
ncbi:attractin-like protein 1 isoform X2 [Acanthaster planci]|uniref:Attractin-like protein 1 isoform X2 n=1 Tax=Acanthaster planci TaxID=133434 RepID=A0A8B7ZYF8_ACAPL|nr:attractin-like protein 1 isoform X2 [Acanthaster planci]